MQRFARAGVAAGVGLVAVVMAGAGRAAAADEKAPDWGGFATVADVVGTVVKADENAVTFRVTWYVPQGGTNRRPNLSGNHRNFHNPYGGRRPGGSGAAKPKEMHHDYVLEYVPQSLVRHKAMPVKLDDKGKRVAWTDKEAHDLRQPAGVPGYVGTKAEVTAGMVVELVVIRDKTIRADRATEDDLRIKYVYLLGPASAAPAASPPEKGSKGNKADN